jgi:hypothetical protein
MGRSRAADHSAPQPLMNVSFLEQRQRQLMAHSFRLALSAK